MKATKAAAIIPVEAIPVAVTLEVATPNQAVAIPAAVNRTIAKN
jgi:hypothetical protein